MKEQQDPTLQRKIKVGNRLILILLGLSLLYTIATLSQGLPIFMISFLGIPICFGFFILNARGNHKIARIVASIFPMIIVTLYHAAVMQPNEPTITASSMFSMILLVIPFVLFDFNEKVELVFSLLTCTTFLLLVRTMNGWVNIPMDNAYARTANYEYAIIILGAVLLTSIMSALLRTNQASEKRNKKLLSESYQRNSTLKASQKELEAFVKQVEVNKVEEENRSWESNTLSRFNELLRGHDNLAEVSDVLLSNIVSSLKANQGAIYIAKQHEGEKKLVGLSCFAHERKRFFETEILVGEGLVGQCFFEQEVIYMTDIPESYFEISSGLGMAPPKALIVVPLTANQQSIGALELASFHNFEEYQKRFIIKLAENIAGTFLNIQNQERTNALLKEVQQLNKTYKVQEQKMQEEIEKLRLENHALKKEHSEVVNNQD